MENYQIYTIVAIGLNLFFVIITLIYLVFFKADPLFSFQDWLGR